MSLPDQPIERPYSQTLSDYGLLENLYRSERTQVFRAIHHPDQRPVILKFLNDPQPTAKDLRRFRKQYTLASPLEHPNILKVETLVTYHNGEALVMADQGDIALDNFLTTHPIGTPGALSLPQVLALGIQLADVLHYLNQQRIIHKDIKPSNLLINPTTFEIKLIDFGLAVSLPEGQREMNTAHRLEGTLAYIAPEQTGRMNRGYDFRADLYSLGVVLYELLTGQCPFQATETLELIYAHLAETPSPPTQLASSVPSMVSQIVMKLLSKEAENRYQSGLGLKRDLEECLEQLLRKQSIEPFELGHWDIPERLQIPTELYGRELELQTLLTQYKKASSGSTVMALVAGVSGVGKTALIQAIYPSITQNHGRFIQGKFEQFNRDIPFSAVVQACRVLVAQLQGNSEQDLAIWRQSLTTALGPLGQVIIDIVPEIEQVIGPQPPVSPLSGAANQNRFNKVFHQFFQVFATPEHPLVLFLDDLQWADDASLKLLKTLLDKKKKPSSLLLLGAYRDNEVSQDHLLMDLVQQRNTQQIEHLKLHPLKPQGLTQFLADTLLCSLEDVEPLMRWAFDSTQGNPFLLARWIKQLEEEHCFSFDPLMGGWQFNLSQVGELTLREQASGFALLQLKKLPATTQHLLSLGAFLGSRFDLQTLSTVTQTSMTQINSELWPAYRLGFIQLHEETTDSIEGTRSGQKNNKPSIAYGFVHDQIQQAAYSLTPESQQVITHYLIGQALLREWGEDIESDSLFAVLHHLNLSLDLLSEPQEYLDVIQLNHQAACKAIASTAYDLALIYITKACELLPADHWTSQYELSLACHNTAIEAAALNHQFEQMECLFEVIESHTKKLIDAAKAYAIKIDVYSSLGQFSEAIQLGLQFLEAYDIHFPQHPTQNDFLEAMHKTQSLLAERSIEELEALPEMTEAEPLALWQIAMQLAVPTYVSRPELYPLTICQQIQLSLAYGNSPSPYVYVAFGVILFAVLEDIESGFSWGQTGIKRLEKSTNQENASKALYGFYHFIFHWKKPLQHTLAPLQNIYSLSLDNGDLTFAGYAAYVYGLHAYYLGRHLPTLEPEIISYSQALAEIQQSMALSYNNIVHQVVQNLLGPQPSTQLEGPIFDESTDFEVFQNADGRVGQLHFHIYKLTLCYLFEEIDSAQDHAMEAHKVLDAGVGMCHIPLLYLYEALALLATIPTLSQDEQVLNDNQWTAVLTAKKKLETWANYCSENFLHRYHLLCAEEYRVRGDRSSAMDAYDKAISGAKANSYIQEEALSNEQAGKFYLDLGKDNIAILYLQEAHRCYGQWGAKAKVSDLEQKYPNIFNNSSEALTQKPHAHFSAFPQPLTSVGISSRTSTLMGLNAMDLEPIMTSAQTLIAIDNIEELIQKLMQLVLISSGAQSCIIAYLDEKRQWAVRGNRIDNSAGRRSQEYPTQLIQWTKNTRVSTLINAQSPISIIDPYLFSYKPQSAFCTPILQGEEILGVLYMEHRQAKDFFTQRDQAVLSFFAIQAAISLEKILCKRDEDSHQIEDNYFASLLKNIPQMAWLEDTQSKILLANEPFLKSFGINVTEPLIGKTFGEWAPSQLIEQVPTDRESVTQSPTLSRVTLDSLEYQVIRTPVKDPDDTQDYILGIWFLLNTPVEQQESSSSLLVGEERSFPQKMIAETPNMPLQLKTEEELTIIQKVKDAQLEYLPKGKCTLINVAAHIGIAPRTLRRRLKEQGTTFKAELLELRIAVASQYLQNSELTIQEISVLLGYDSSGTFIRAFRRAKEMTPKAYRGQSQISEKS